LNFELFIAKRLVSGKESKGYVSRRLVNTTTFGISLGLAVMLISVSVVTGFKNEITDKVIGFGSHIQIEYLDNNTSFETKPISKNQAFLHELLKMQEIKNIQPFGIKAGIMKTKAEFQGIVLKGVDEHYDWSFFKKNLIEGRIPNISNNKISSEIIISQQLANMMELKTGDKVALYFMQEPVKVRPMQIVGLYQTGLGDMDKIFVLSDIKQVQKLNDWDSTQISGFEVNITDYNQVDKITAKLSDHIGLILQPDGSSFRISNIKIKYPQIFDWLNLQNLNVIVILVIMLLVAGLNMVSGLIILILERTKMIGLLVSLGSPSKSIRKIFLYQSGFLITKGLLWGNLIGLSILYLQKTFKWIKLDESSYFINSVPVNFDLGHILLLNIGTLSAIMIILIIPSLIISKINPEFTLKYN
jgi:lipoprotein-releasing system permease protein